MPTLHVVAGPNGCGKSTLTRTTWFSGVEVIDPGTPHREVAMFTGATWWSAERLPIWAAAAIDRVTARRP